MKQFIGNGKINACCSQLVITGNSNNIPGTYTIVNQINFPNLTFSLISNDLITFNQSTGIFTMQYDGIFFLNSTLNVQASQASAEIHLIPKFNNGTGTPWTTGSGRKTVLTAIKPTQTEWSGMREFVKGNQFIFKIAAHDGNISFKTETLDPGGPDECSVPAAIFYIMRNIKIESLL